MIQQFSKVHYCTEANLICDFCVTCVQKENNNMTSLHQKKYATGQASQIIVWVACPVSDRWSRVTVLYFWNTHNMSLVPPMSTPNISFSVKLSPSPLPSFLPPWVSPDTGRQDSFWTHQPNSPGARARKAGVPLNTRQDWQSDRKRARPRQPVLPHCGEKTRFMLQQ